MDFIAVFVGKVVWCFIWTFLIVFSVPIICIAAVGLAVTGNLRTNIASTVDT